MPGRLTEPWQLSSYAAVTSASPFIAASTSVQPAASTSKTKLEDQDVAVVTVQGDGIHLVEVCVSFAGGTEA
jgi:hypothetical protein